MTQVSFSDYHLYSLGRKTTINNSQTKQVSMLSGTGVPVRKRYVVDGQAMYYRNMRHPGSPLRDDVAAYYEFRNDAASGLGMPMPVTFGVRPAACSLKGAAKDPMAQFQNSSRA